MIKLKYLIVFLFTTELFSKFTICANREKDNLKDALRNGTSSRSGNQDNKQNGNTEEADSVLKSEAKKLLKQCGVDSDNSQDSVNFGNNKDRYSNKYDSRKLSYNNKNYNGQEETEDGDGNNNGDGNWNMYGQNWKRSQNQFNSRKYNTYKGQSSNQNNQNGQSYSYNSQNFDRSPNQYGSDARRGYSDENQNTNGNRDRYGSQNNNYPNESSSNRKQNNRNEYSSQGSNNQDEYSDQSYNNNQNEYGGQNSNSYDGQNYGNENGNYGQSNRRDRFYNNQRAQNGNGGYSPQNDQMGINHDSNSYYPFNNRGLTNQNSDCDDNNRNTFGGNSFGYIPGGRFASNIGTRSKRYNYANRDESEQNDDNQCISQCVFGYLQLLDEDRTPSETMVIKWLQEHVTGNDMDRIKALRDTRRCFAKLTTTDIEDGCDFSKELADCLNLDLE